MPVVTCFSAEMVRAIPDDGSRYETVYGELLVTPAPRVSHQRVASYWVVDIEHALIEVWTPEALFPVVERERVSWRHPGTDTARVIEIAALLGG